MTTSTEAIATHSSADPSRVLKGDLAYVAFADLMSVMGLLRRTAQITIRRQGRLAVIHFENGDLESVELDGRLDDSALDQILGWSEGEFEVKETGSGDARASSEAPTSDPVSELDSEAPAGDSQPSSATSPVSESAMTPVALVDSPDRVSTSDTAAGALSATSRADAEPELAASDRVARLSLAADARLTQPSAQKEPAAAAQRPAPVSPLAAPPPSVQDTQEIELPLLAATLARLRLLADNDSNLSGQGQRQCLSSLNRSLLLLMAVSGFATRCLQRHGMEGAEAKVAGLLREKQQAMALRLGPLARLNIDLSGALTADGPLMPTNGREAGPVVDAAAALARSFLSAIERSHPGLLDIETLDRVLQGLDIDPGLLKDPGGVGRPG